MEAEGMLAVAERFRLAVSALLVKIGLYRVAPEVPDDGGRAEADGVAGILEAPADVDVVAGRAIERIEAAEAEQHVALECHVAAGDMLGNVVAHQHMRRP